MAIGTRRSGLIQRVRSSVTHGLTEVFDFGSQIVGGDIIDALKDPNSPNAIPDVPTTEAPYDGYVAFGIYSVDVP